MKIQLRESKTVLPSDLHLLTSLSLSTPPYTNEYYNKDYYNYLT